jgi:hypothetical protein
MKSLLWRHRLAWFIACIGWTINIAYHGYEYIEYGPLFLEHFKQPLLEHLMIISAIPMFMFVGYLFEREGREREKSKVYAEELEHAGEMKDLFTDIMRHDLLNPVGVIKNVLEILKEDPSLEGSRKQLEMLSRNARKLEDMIKDASRYIELASLEKLDFEVKDLSAVINSAVLDFQPLAAEKDITIENRVEGEHLARVNPFIEGVFSNLLSNAIKYSPEKTRVTISAEDLEDRWRIMVKDQGEGIKDEYKEMIFQRFKKEKKEGIKGTGLGLAIVKRIVELHQGRVWVEDNPEGGSIFYVEIPKGF